MTDKEIERVKEIRNKPIDEVTRHDVMFLLNFSDEIQRMEEKHQEKVNRFEKVWNSVVAFFDR